MGYQYVRAVVMVKQLRYEINAYRHWSCEFESRSGEVYSIKHYVIKFSVICDSSMVFSSYFSTNKSDRHDITEIPPFDWPPRYNWNTSIWLTATI